MTKVTIIGLGLIGGSLGLALKRFGGGDWRITGYSRRPETARKALEIGAVDVAEPGLGRAASETDMVVLAAPIGVTRDLLGEIAPHLAPGCVVTDTCSTKGRVLEWAGSLLPPGVEFVGGHPMAGKETWGLDVAEANLFEGATYCIVPPPGATSFALGLVTKLAKAVRARPLVVSAAAHDHMVAGISHLPLVLSAALVAVTQQDPKWPDMSLLAAGGYRDTTRLASGNPDMGRDICLTNREAVLSWIDRFATELSQFRKDIDLADGKGIEARLTSARKAREAWSRQRSKSGG
ncbi:MAG: prephenate dehydrogenase/arogenate dehydrogenase family protein [Chloroflexi bacterium]|nr:prephenate dehydrogenase/arogenate dehydrogenase family protein [Chloroflexota bacterium]